MPHINHHARRIAAALSTSEIAGRTTAHAAMRAAQIDRDAHLVARLAELAGLDLAAIEGRLLLAQPSGQDCSHRDASRTAEDA